MMGIVLLLAAGVVGVAGLVSAQMVGHRWWVTGLLIAGAVLAVTFVVRLFMVRGVPHE